MEIHVKLAGVQLGPYSPKQVQEYLDEGLLSLGDQALEVGTTDWVSVEAILTKASLEPQEPAAAPEEDEGLILGAQAAAEPAEAEAPQDEPEEAVAEEEEERRAPQAGPGVSHLPSRQREPIRQPLSPVVEALAKNTVLIGPQPPRVPSPSGRTGAGGYGGVLTTSPLSKTQPPKKDKVARSSLVKALAQSQTSPLPTKSLVQMKEQVAKPGAPQTTAPMVGSATGAPPVNVPAPPAPETPAEPAPQEAPSGVKLDQNRPRQTLLKSLTAKTVPMRTNAAPPLSSSQPSLITPPPMSASSIPVTAPMPSKGLKNPGSGTVAPPSEVAGLTKKLHEQVKPDAGPVRAPQGSAPPSGLRPPNTQIVTTSKARMAAEPPVNPADELLVDTVKLDRVKLPTKVKASDSGAIPAAKKPDAQQDDKDDDEKEKVKAPATPKRFWLWLILGSGALALVTVYYVYSSFHAATALQSALKDGDESELAAAVDFKSVQDSLKQQVKDNLAGRPQSAALSNAEDMMDKSIDQFVTAKGISGLVSKPGKFSDDDDKLAQTISMGTAMKLVAAFNSQQQPDTPRGFASPTDFLVVTESAIEHLRLTGITWKLKQVTLNPTLLVSSDANAGSPLLQPVVDTFMERADAKAKKNDWAGAIADYTQALNVDPNASVAFTARAAAKQAKGDVDGAMKDYSDALKSDPNLATAYEGRGNVKAVRNDIDGAIADYTLAIHNDPNLALAYDGRGNAKTAKDDLDGAISDYTQAIAIDPNLASAYSDRGFARQANGNLDGAILDYTEALKLKPNTAVAYYNRGLARQQQGNFESAIVDFDHAISFNPKSAEAFYNRGNSKNALHDLDGALTDYTQAITLNPKVAQQYCSRGVVRQAKGDLDGALEDYTKALTMDPKIAVAYFNRARIKVLKGDPDGAISDSSQALDLDPKNVQAYFNRGIAKLIRNNLDGAHDDLKQFCEGAPHDKDADHARLFLWLIEKAQGKVDPNQELSDALENNWNSSPDDLPSKIASYLLGRMPEADFIAAVTSTDAKKDAGAHCEAWYFAGMKRLLMGDKATAVDYFHKCIATGQSDYWQYLLADAELKVLEAPAPAPAATVNPAGDLTPGALVPATPTH